MFWTLYVGPRLTVLGAPIAVFAIACSAVANLSFPAEIAPLLRVPKNTRERKRKGCYSQHAAHNQKTTSTGLPRKPCRASTDDSTIFSPRRSIFLSKVSLQIATLA
jgi:hypothetical protein